MVFVLSQLVPPNTTGLSILVQLYPDSPPCIVTSKHTKLEFNILNNELGTINTLDLDEPLLALNHFQHSNLPTECLILLTESYQLIIIWYDYNKHEFVILNTINFNSSNQLLPSDILPQIVVDPVKTPRYFSVYLFEGFVQVFCINNKWELVETSRKRRLDMDLLDEFTFSVGGIVVQDLKPLHASFPTLTILYRDYNYNYSLRSYELNLFRKSASLLKQFEEFDDPPTTLVNPPVGGIFVLSDNYIFYFPDKRVNHLELEDTDPNLSCNSSDKVITKRLINHDISAFLVSTVIDERRILLIDNKGATFILFFDHVSLSMSSLQVNSMNFVRLGMTTVPTAVHNINENYFFVSSKLSQSMIFRVLPKEPYIDIVQFITSSSPILDLNVQALENSLQITTCQGGFECGEYRNVSRSLRSAEFRSSFQCTTNYPKLEVFYDEVIGSILRLVDHESGVLQFFKIDRDFNHSPVDLGDEDCMAIKQTRDSLLKVTLTSISVNESLIAEVSVLKVKTVSSTRLIVLDKSNNLHLVDEDSKHIFSLETTDEVSDLDLVHVYEHQFLVLVAFWNGSYRIYLVDATENELIFEGVISHLNTSVTSCALRYDDHLNADSVWVLLMSSSNDLVQEYLNFRTVELDHHRSSITHFNGSSFTLVKGNHETVMFNKKYLYLIQLDVVTMFNKISQLIHLPPQAQLNDVTLFGSDSYLAASTNVNDILIYDILSTTPTTDIMFSKDFNIKSLDLSRNKSLLISSKTIFNETLNEYGRNSFLQLIDKLTMSPLSKVEFQDNEPLEISDGCLLAQNDGSNEYVMVLCNSEIPLKIFQVKKNQLVEVKVQISGLAPRSDVAYSSIKLVDENNRLYLISGTVNYIIQPQSVNEWVVISHCFFKSPVFTTAASTINDNVVFGDAMKGLTSLKITETASNSFEFDHSSKCHYKDMNLVTSICKFTSEESGEQGVLVVDSLGNLVGLSLDEDQHEFKEILIYNIGDPINKIVSFPQTNHKLDFHSKFDKLEMTKQDNTLIPKAIMGTVNGGIYTLSELSDIDNEIEEIITECCEEIVKYRKTVSDLYNNKTDKLSQWYRAKGFKLLQQDEEGYLVRKPANAVVDLILIQQWLIRDAGIDVIDYSSEVQDMKKNLKKCYRHQNLLQKLVHQALYI